MIGCRRWWENVDRISQRRNSSQISLNPDSLDRLNIQSLFKYADDSNIVAPGLKNCDSSADLVNDFLKWSEHNQLLSNPSKCKELTFRKKNDDEIR